MSGLTAIVAALVGAFSLGLPIWFAFLDQKALPGLLWMGEGEPTPLWGHLVVVVGLLLAVLVAVAAPFSGFEATH